MFPTPLSPDNDPRVHEDDDFALAEEILTAAKMERRIPRAVERLRRLLLREAVSCAVDALYHWIARGVEWYHATCGWIYLLDEDRKVLRPISGATVRSLNRREEIPLDSPRGRFMARVCKERKGDFTNDVDSSRRLSDCHKLDYRTKSELAVPLFDENGSEGGHVIGVCNLESEHKRRFFPAQVIDVSRNMALLTMHLLVLRDWYARRDSRPWVWHPEVHGWSPGKLMERFCHTVARHAARAGDPLPSCSIWNADAKTGKCWVLGTSGFDYDFLSLYALGPDSAVGSVAAAACKRAMRRGTPKEVEFKYLTKADEMGVREVVIVSLNGRPDQGVHGTFNLYSLDERTPLPADKLLRRLAAQAERFLATVNRQRVSFAKAYIRGRLAKAAAPNPDFRILRKALIRVLPVNALSIFVPRKEEGKDVLQCIDGTGFEKEMKKVLYPLKDRREGQESIAAHCFTRPGTVARINFGPDDPERLLDQIPKPSPSHPEKMDEEDEDFDLRRRFMIGVPGLAGRGGDSLGVIGMYRSAKGRPFTEADRELFRSIGTSWECCGALFDNRKGKDKVSLHVYSSPLHLLAGRLRENITELRKLAVGNWRGSVFVRCDESPPRYFRYVCYPHNWTPDDIRYEPIGDIGAGRTHSEDIIVKPGKGRDGEVRTRICVPLSAWDESHLVRAIVAFDFDAKPPSDDVLLPAVFKAAVSTCVFFAKNNCRPDKGIDGDILGEFSKYVATEENVAPNGQRVFTSRPSPADLPRLVRCLDPELRRSKVRLTADNSFGLIPLPIGPVEAAWLLCPLAEDLKRKLAHAREQYWLRRRARKEDAKASARSTEEEEAWRKLRQTVGLVTGSWTRLVVAGMKLWQNVQFKQQRTDEDAKVWKAIFRWPHPSEETGR